MSTELVNVQTAVAEFDRVAAGLAALKEQYGGIVYEVHTTKGMEAAKAARAAIREPRYEIERIRKNAKAPIIALGKRLDSEAARITAELDKLESPVDEVIKREEARKEAEKQAKIEAERKRFADLQERVAMLRGNTMLSASSAPELIAEHIADLERITVDDSFQEFRKQAEDAKAAGLARLRDLHAAAVAGVAENARIMAEREELAKLRAEQAEREAESRAKIAEEERLAKVARDAELAEQRRVQAVADAELVAKRKAEQEELQDQRDAQAIIAANIAAERAELDRQNMEKELAKEAEYKARADRQRIANMVKPPDHAIISVIASHYVVPNAKVIEWLKAMELEVTA